MVYYETLARGCQSVQSGSNISTRDLETCSASATGNTIFESIESATVAISFAFVEGFINNYDDSFFVYQTNATFTTKVIEGSQPPSPPPTPPPPPPPPSNQTFLAIASITTTAYLLASPESTRIFISSESTATAPTKVQAIALAGLDASKKTFAKFTTNPIYDGYQIISSNVSITTSIVVP